MTPVFYRRSRFWMIVAVALLMLGGFTAWQKRAATAAPTAPAATIAAPVLELLPSDVITATRQDVRRVLPLTGPDVALRAYAVTRAGRAVWPPLALVVDLLAGRVRR